MFKYLLIFLSLFGCTGLLFQPCPEIAVCFTPGGNCTEQVINAVDQAQKSILIQVYEFTSEPIAKSLIQAKERGIDVKVILDKSQIQSKYSVIHELKHSYLD